MDRSGGSYARTLSRLLLFDLQGTAPCVLLWWLGDLAYPPNIALFTVLRMAAWFLVLWQVMAPIRRWESMQVEAASDAELLALDAELQAIPQRFARRYALIWMISMGSLACMSLAGLPAAGPEFGPSERVAVLFLVAANSIPVSKMFVSSTRHVLAEPLFELGRAVVARGLQLRRPPLRRERLGGQFVAMLVAAYVLILAPVVLLWHGHARRDAALVHAQQLGLRALVDLQHGRKLPEHVARIDDTPLDAHTLAAFAEAQGPDSAGVEAIALPARGHALARVQLDDGPTLIAEVEIDEQVAELGLGLLGLLLVLCAAAWEGGRDLMRETLAPVEQFNETTRRFGESGELSKLARIVPLQHDEIGQLALHFNTMLDILEELSLAANSVAEGHLEVRFTHPGQLHASFDRMVSRLAESVGQLRSVSRELAAVSHELEALTAQQQRGAQAQLELVSRVGESLLALESSGELVGASAATVVDEAQQSLLGAREISAQLAELREVSEGITSLLERVGEVADRSDLLALNGSLEAVRAGEVGRGFALVAAEMRRLAERAAHTLDDARARVTEVDAVGAATVAVAERGRERAEATMRAAEEIAGETSARSREAAVIVANMREVSASVRDGARLTSQTRAAAAGLNARASALEQLLEGFEEPHDESPPRAATPTQDSASSIRV